MNKKSETENTQVDDHPKTREETAAILEDLSKQITELQRKLALARGTRNSLPPQKLDLLVRIEQYLRGHICTTSELAKALGEDESKVQDKLKSVRKHVVNVATAEAGEARWIWRVGDETPAKELRDVVARLIEGHAMTTAELSTITGARMSRINGVIVDLQRMVKTDEGTGEQVPAVPIFNVGSTFRAKWLIVPPTAKPANLPPKGAKR